jgi:hypothetical protein
LAISPVQAANLLQNGGFEDTAGTFVDSGLGFAVLSPGSTIIPGWTITTARVVWIETDVNIDGITTPFGSFLVDIGGAEQRILAGVTQTINTTVGQNYTLSLSLGILNPIAPGPVSVVATAGSSSQIFTFNSSDPGNQWGSFSFDFIATSTSTPICIVGTSNANFEYIGLDNVSVEENNLTSVPESSSILGLFSLGILGIGATLKRKL